MDLFYNSIKETSSLLSSFSGKNFDIPTLLSGLDFPSEFIDRVPDDKKLSEEFQWNPQYLWKDDECLWGLPSGLSGEKPKLESSGKPRSSPRVLYKDLFLKVRDGIVDEPTFIAATRLALNRTSLFVHVDEQGEGHIRRGKVKGSEFYYRLFSKRIADWVKACEEKEGQWAMVTYTYGNQKDPYSFMLDWLSAWENFTPYGRNLRRRISCDMFTALEAHESGFPHFHSLIRLYGKPRATFKDSKGVTRFCDRKFRENLRKGWSVGFADVKVCDDGSAAYYLSKYLSKGFNPSTLPKKYDKRALTPDERKAIIGLMMSKLCGVRSLSFTKPKAYIGLKNRRKEERDVLKRERVFSRIQKILEEGSFDLSSLMNNFTVHCRGRSWVVVDRDLRRQLGLMIGASLDKDKVKRLVSGKGVQRIGCDGCLFCRLADNSGIQAKDLIADNNISLKRNDLRELVTPVENGGVGEGRHKYLLKMARSCQNKPPDDT
jgi:hypothetical protein